MKITPIEIRQKTFEKTFRGYEKEEVDAFLVSLSQEWERVMNNVQDLKQKLVQSETDVQKLRDVESSLYRTLKTAEDTGANMMEQANRDAELQLREAQMQAEAILSDAKNQARDLIDEAELRAREISGELRDDIKRLENDYRTLEDYRGNLILEMKTLANNTLDRLSNQKIQEIDFSSIMKATNVEFESKVSKEPLLGESKVDILDPIYSEEKPNEVMFEIEGDVVDLSSHSTDIEEGDSENNTTNESPKDTGGSFFDSLG